MPLSPSTLSDVSLHDDSQSQPSFAQEVSSAVLTQMEPRISTARKQRQRNMPNEDDEILTAARARLTTPPSPLDQNDLFGKAIGMHLKNVSTSRAFMVESLYTK